MELSIRASLGCFDTHRGHLDSELRWRLILPPSDGLKRKKKNHIYLSSVHLHIMKICKQEDECVCGAFDTFAGCNAMRKPTKLSRGGWLSLCISLALWKFTSAGHALSLTQMRVYCASHCSHTHTAIVRYVTCKHAVYERCVCCVCVCVQAPVCF